MPFLRRKTGVTTLTRMMGAMVTGQIDVLPVTDERTDEKLKIEQNAGRPETLLYPSLCWNDATGWYRVATPYMKQCFL